MERSRGGVRGGSPSPNPDSYICPCEWHATQRRHVEGLSGSLDGMPLTPPEMSPPFTGGIVSSPGGPDYPHPLCPTHPAHTSAPLAHAAVCSHTRSPTEEEHFAQGHSNNGPTEGGGLGCWSPLPRMCQHSASMCCVTGPGTVLRPPPTTTTSVYSILHDNKCIWGPLNLFVFYLSSSHVWVESHIPTSHPECVLTGKPLNIDCGSMELLAGHRDPRVPLPSGIWGGDQTASWQEIKLIWARGRTEPPPTPGLRKSHKAIVAAQYKPQWSGT